MFAPANQPQGLAYQPACGGNARWNGQSTHC